MATRATLVTARKYGLPESGVILAADMTANEAARFLGVSKHVGGILAGSDDLDLTTVFDAGESGYSDGFVFTWTRADKPKVRTTTVAGGATETITGIPTGTYCQVLSVEPEAAAPTDYHFNAAVLDPEDGGVHIAEGTNVEVEATIEIEMDPGSLEISKVLVDGDESGYAEPFTIEYTVDGGTAVEVEVDAAGSVTVDDLPGGAEIVVTETLPDDPEGFEFSAAVLDPVDGTVEIVPNDTVTVEVTNTIAAVVG